ncbi:hypothetical protein GGI20_002625 [Coemansia sp. BCRC 34301]|nr:hypothetical protein GGI20_002625 [Coemansia sp. BCRC 34301]
MPVCIDCLDERVLGCIIAHAYHHDFPRLADYKRLLSLAGVNKTWRRLAHTHTHTTIIIECQLSRVTQQPGRQSESKRRSKAINAVSVWNRSTGTLPLTKTISNTNSLTSTVEPAWQTNLPVILAANKIMPSRICVQAFDVVPDYSSLVDALAGAGFARRQWTGILHLAIRDGSGMRHSLARDSAVGSNNSSNSSLAASLHKMRGEGASSRAAAALIAKHAPNISNVTSNPWECSLGSRSLGSALAGILGSQLRVCRIPFNSPPTLLCAQLASLSIQTSILRSLPPNTVPTTQLHTLRLLQAEAFFTWEAFASSSSSQLEFGCLACLAIDFARDHVANDSHRYDARKGGMNPRVTMGVDRRRIVFPRLRALCIRRLPYTYQAAWTMFLDAPIDSLAVAGKFAHLRYIDTRILHNLRSLDMHVYLSEKSFAKFTAFIKTVLAVPSTVRSVWIRHSEVFPVSVPEVSCGSWSQLEEINLTAYVPVGALLALVAQLPVLRRVIAQRISRDDSEAPLDPSAEHVFHIEPGSVASTSVRALQLHLGGGRTRISTLQTIIFVVLCMPRLRTLAVKQAYWPGIRRFIHAHGEKYPELLRMEYVHHISMLAMPIQLI